MLQIIGFQLCALMIVGGVLAYLLGHNMDGEKSKDGRTIGSMALVGSILLAALFIVLLTEQGRAFSNIMPDLQPQVRATPELKAQNRDGVDARLTIV